MQARLSSQDDFKFKIQHRAGLEMEAQYHPRPAKDAADMAHAEKEAQHQAIQS